MSPQLTPVHRRKAGPQEGLRGRVTPEMPPSRQFTGGLGVGHLCETLLWD